MKSVVVEASTVAKAIELAWQKAEKPEEFFIRILQEHSSGFLGFGAQKAKIVFFFKNTQKSDSLFPVVLKQKEYTSLFDNNKLKVPSQLNVVDHELNKNVALGQKKKQHPQAKPAHQPRPTTQDAKPHQTNQAPHIKNQPQAKPQLNLSKTQVKIELQSKPVTKQEPIVKKDVVVKKPQIQKAQAPQVSKVAQKPQVIASETLIINKIEELVQLPMTSLPTTHMQPVVTSVAAAPRIIQKMKRRPLPGADQSVSGITKSSPKTSDTSKTYLDLSKTISDLGKDRSEKSFDVNDIKIHDKGDQE